MTTGLPADGDSERRAVINVAVIAFDGEENPSTRLRILQYIKALERDGFEFSTFFVSQYGPRRDRSDSKRVLGLVADADVVFVQRVLSKSVLRILKRAGKPVIFDFDDALHYIRQSQYPAAVTPKGVTDRLRNAYRTVTRGSRYYSGRKKRLDEMLGVATTVIAGNEWLVGELGLESDRTIVVPTSVWVSEAQVKVHEQSRPITLGWIGVRSNLYHLELLGGAFRELRRRYGEAIELKVVSSVPINTALVTRFEPWSLDAEDAAVVSFDIGLMPLQDDPFSRGKCAFKAIQCMSHGVPVIASPVGANATLIEHGSTGWLAASTDDWVEGISMLVEDVGKRAQMGRCARQAIERRYSAEQVTALLADVLRCAAA